MLDACIIGAPKCGTSSLFRWLVAHPEIIGPCGQKELFFFMDEGHPLTNEPNIHTSILDTYRSLFPDSESASVLEATTHYLFQDAAQRYLAAMDTEPLIIALLRDPAERVWSSFQYTRNNQARIDPELSFAKYVDWSLSGKAHRIRPFINGSTYVLERDVAYSEYIRYLIPWRQVVGDERLFVLQFEELVSSPQSVCQDIATAVGVDPEVYGTFDFSARNATYRIRSQALHAVARIIGEWLPDGGVKRLVKEGYMAMATDEDGCDRTEADKQAIKRLREYFEPYNQHLATEFCLDLSAWS